MSRSWNTWLARWKSAFQPNRRTVRRAAPVRLRTEMLETRITPAVTYGSLIGQSSVNTGTPPGSSQPSSPPVVTLDSLGGSTFATNQTITGMVEEGGIPLAGASVTVTVGTGAPQSVVVSTSGEFSFTTTFATDGTANGLKTFTFVARDASGRVSAPVTTSFTLTSTTSNLTLTLDPASDTGTAGNNITELSAVTLDGTGPDNSTITLTQTGATTTSDANGNFSFTNVALQNGPNKFTVTATDSAGNPLTASLTVIKDTAPTVSSPVANFQVAQSAANSLLNLPTIFEDQDVNAVVQFTTNRGTFDVELFGQQTPATVANFLSYVEGTDTAGSNYTETIFHRVVNANDPTDPIGILQGGGFKLDTSSGTVTLPAIPTAAAIALEAGLTNALGTIAMARTSAANSATSQFYFNTADNASLDPSSSSAGFAVFGVILPGNGLSVVQASAAVPPVNEGGNFSAIPLSGGHQPDDPNFPTDTSPSDYEVVTGVTVLSQPAPGFADSLTFTVSGNTDPGLVTPTIHNGLLSLAYTAGQSGTSTITLTATDSDGASVQTSFTVTVGTDTEAPAVTITSPAAGASVKTSPAITGTATDNVGVTSLTASVDGGAAQTVAVNADGTFTFNPNLAVDGSADGSHMVVFTAMDAAGNTSTATATFNLDTTAPVVTITSPTDGQTFTSSPPITGTATDNETLASLTASVDNGAAQAVTVGSDGSFSFTPSTTADGPHTVTFTATDAAGNTSTPETLTYTISAASPAVTLTAPDDGQAFNSDPAFTGSVTDASEAGNLTVSVDGGPLQPVTVESDGSFSFTPSIATDGSADGTHTLVFSAGSSFTTVSRSFVLDTTAPAITITSPPSGQTDDSNPTIAGTIVDATTSVATATASVDGGPAQTLDLDAQGNFTFIPVVATGGSADGPHTVTITATDAVGNVSTPVVFTYTLDTVPPTITITSPAEGTVSSADPVFVGTVTDPESAVSLLTVSVNGGAAQAVTVDSQGNFSFDPHFATDGSADGFYTFAFVAQDAAGNQATVTQHYTFGTQPPVVTITSPPNNQTFITNPTIQGSVSSDIGSSTVNVYVDGTFVTQVSFPTNGTFSYTTTLPTDGTANGQHTVTFIALDPAGNQSAPATFTFMLLAP